MNKLLMAMLSTIILSAAANATTGASDVSSADLTANGTLVSDESQDLYNAQRASQGF